MNRHFCASIYVIDPDTKKILLVQHKKWNRWTQPGGHIEDNETPYLEEIITTEYWIDESKNPPERLFETSETTYELYVPEGSVTTVFEFNADY